MAGGMGMKNKFIPFVLLNFFEGVREKIFWGVVFFSLFLLGLSFFLSMLSVGESARVLRGAGLSAMELGGIVLLVFSFTSGFYRDRNGRILEVYLSCVPRSVYTASKVCAYLLIAFFYLILAGVFWAGILAVNGAFFWQFWAGLFSIFLKLSIVIFLNLVFCCLFSSPVLAILSTLFLYACGEIVSEAARLSTVYVKGEFSATVLSVLKYILPNLDKLDLKSQLLYAQVPAAGYLGLISLYTLLYCLFLWSLGTWIFAKKK
jgi:hypothetical protein